jgi:hypothetical protein
MKREEWVDREIRTVVQGIHHVLGVGNAGEEPVSPLTISTDPPPEEEVGDPAPPLESEDVADAAPVPLVPAPGTRTRRAARRKHKHDKR